MTNLYHFYEAIDDNDKNTDIFYVQCEWFNKTIDLDSETAENEEYCRIIITDLNDYWQHTITRDMLIERFKPSTCLIQSSRNKVLSLSLRGSKWIKNHEIQWAYVKCENEQIELKLRVHYFDMIYGVAGSFFMDKMLSDKKDLNKAWYKNCAAASLKANETEEALTLRHDDMKNICDELKDTINTLKTESIEYRFTLFSNFSKVINTKKEKIAELNSKVNYLEKRTRDEPEDSTSSSIKSQKTNSSTSKHLIKKEEPLEELSQALNKPKSSGELTDEAKASLYPVNKGKSIDKGKKPDRDMPENRNHTPLNIVMFETSDEESEDELKDLFDKKTKSFGL